MKSEERLKKEREKSNTLFFVLGFSFLMIVLISLLIFSSSNADSGFAHIINVVKSEFMLIFDKISFKFNNFFEFVRG